MKVLDRDDKIIIQLEKDENDMVPLIKMALTLGMSEIAENAPDESTKRILTRLVDELAEEELEFNMPIFEFDHISSSLGGALHLNQQQVNDIVEMVARFVVEGHRPSEVVEHLLKVYDYKLTMQLILALVITGVMITKMKDWSEGDKGWI